MGEPARVQISALVSPALRSQLQHAAIDMGRSQSDLVAQALQEFLDRLNAQQK